MRRLTVIKLPRCAKYLVGDYVKITWGRFSGEEETIICRIQNIDRMEDGYWYLMRRYGFGSFWQHENWIKPVE